MLIVMASSAIVWRPRDLVGIPHPCRFRCLLALCLSIPLSVCMSAIEALQRDDSKSRETSCPKRRRTMNLEVTRVVAVGKYRCKLDHDKPLQAAPGEVEVAVAAARRVQCL
jgi:hypothetical protein